MQIISVLLEELDISFVKINLSLRNRIAFYFMTVTAVVTAILFLVIYNMVYDTVYNHLDEDLEIELSEVSNSVVVLNEELIFTNSYEFSELEHKQVEVNPTFIQLVDTLGNNIRRTPNLIDNNLFFEKKQNSKVIYNTKVSGSPVRQIQAPIKDDNNQIKAYLIIAIPLEESELVLENLKYVLFISYPLVLILFFSISRLIAGRIVSPVNNIITTAAKITKENINERISIPPRKDELYRLTETINSLLDRLEDTILRERQFTADASHELRTPISVIKGTLEVLIRKERSPEQYKEKVQYVISEVDRMANLVEQLLSLARFESNTLEPMIGPIDVKVVVDNVIKRFNNKIKEKEIIFKINTNSNCEAYADMAMTEIIIENLISNAVKYSDKEGKVSIGLAQLEDKFIFSVQNFGSIIPEEQKHNIFKRFFRTDQSRTSRIEGKGLGLAIVKRLVDLQGLSITFDSSIEAGTTFTIIFPTNK